MQDYFSEIAIFAKLGRISLFTGTGFSKAVSNNQAPSWQSLLEDTAKLSSRSEEILNTFFNKDQASPLSLEERAQIMQLYLEQDKYDMHSEIADIIRELKLAKNIPNIKKFVARNNFTAITTNYDLLLEEIIGEDNCCSISPGSPVPKYEAPIKVYHVHGSVHSPKDMIITSDDYYNFMNEESYFSRKLSTLLHENMVIILGYSLNDTNLKRIISSYRNLSKKEATGSNIFFISRDEVPKEVSAFYRHCFGIRVISNLEIEDFFRQLNVTINEIDHDNFDDLIDHASRLMINPSVTDENYLRQRESFFEIITALSALGNSVNNPRIHEIIDTLITEKRALCLQPGQWGQYSHLASWLIHLCQAFDIKGANIEKSILDSILWSMTHSAPTGRLGASWEAHDVWLQNWGLLTLSNKNLVKMYVEEHSTDADALRIVRS